MPDRVGSQASYDDPAIWDGDVFSVARRLLGSRVRTKVDGILTEVELTEVEAYAGADDPASHAYTGGTRRNASMFGPAGTLYVYISYGVHWCMNIVVGEPGLPHAVLLRGGTPTEGLETIKERRGRSDHLTDGPGKLCQALAVTGALDRSSVVDGPLGLEWGRPRTNITSTPRIGLTRAADRLWRYVLAE